jgi:hypothetical protein
LTINGEIMSKYTASILLTAFLCSSAFAGSEGPNTSDVMASFDRMLNHRPVAPVQSGASERDILQEAFADRLWSGTSTKARQPIADSWASPGRGERPAGALIIDAATATGKTRH